MNHYFYLYRCIEMVSCNCGGSTVWARWETVNDGAGALCWDIDLGNKIGKVLQRNRVIAVGHGAWSVLMMMGR